MSYNSRDLLLQIEEKEARIRLLETLLKANTDIIEEMNEVIANKDDELKAVRARMAQALRTTSSQTMRSPASTSLDFPQVATLSPSSSATRQIFEDTSHPPVVHPLARDRCPWTKILAEREQYKLVPPPDRAAAIAFAPIMVAERVSGASPCVFTRASLKHILGGNAMTHIVRISLTQRDLAAEYAIEQYMILSWEFSPWLPAAPGHHGYAFFSPKLPQALDFDGPRHLFAGVMGNFYYCGLYNTETVSNVSPEEWARVLPLAWAHKHMQNLARSRCGSGGTHEMRRQYLAGEATAYCVRLRCVEFDNKFYRRLVHEAEEFFKLPNRS